MAYPFRSAIFLVGATWGLWFILCRLAYANPNILFWDWHRNYAEQAVLLMPILFVYFAAKIFTKDRREATVTEWLGFHAIVILGFGIGAYVTEAALLHAEMTWSSEPLSSLLITPFSRRLVIASLFNLSFWLSALLVAALLSFLVMPKMIAFIQRRTR